MWAEPGPERSWRFFTFLLWKSFLVFVKFFNYFIVCKDGDRDSENVDIFRSSAQSLHCLWRSRWVDNSVYFLFSDAVSVSLSFSVCLSMSSCPYVPLHRPAVCPGCGGTSCLPPLRPFAPGVPVQCLRGVEDSKRPAGGAPLWVDTWGTCARMECTCWSVPPHGHCKNRKRISAAVLSPTNRGLCILQSVCDVRGWPACGLHSLSHCCRSVMLPFRPFDLWP